MLRVPRVLKSIIRITLSFRPGNFEDAEIVLDLGFILVGLPGFQEFHLNDLRTNDF
jgi:hypothetical protein